MNGTEENPDRNLWKRLIDKRCREYEMLEENVRLEIIESAWKKHPFPQTLKKNVQDMNNSKRIEVLMRDHLLICSNETDIPVVKRRSSLDALKELLSKINDEKIKLQKKTSSTDNNPSQIVVLDDSAEDEDMENDVTNNPLDLSGNSALQATSRQGSGVALSVPVPDIIAENGNIHQNYENIEPISITQPVSQEVLPQIQNPFRQTTQQQPIVYQVQQDYPQQQPQQQQQNEQRDSRRVTIEHCLQQLGVDVTRSRNYIKLGNSNKKGYWRFYCTLCKIHFEGPREILIDHCKGQNHQTLLNAAEAGTQSMRSQQHHQLMNTTAGQQPLVHHQRQYQQSQSSAQRQLPQQQSLNRQRQMSSTQVASQPSSLSNRLSHQHVSLQHPQSRQAVSATRNFPQQTLAATHHHQYDQSRTSRNPSQTSGSIITQRVLQTRPSFEPPTELRQPAANSHHQSSESTISNSSAGVRRSPVPGTTQVPNIPNPLANGSRPPLQNNGISVNHDTVSLVSSKPKEHIFLVKGTVEVVLALADKAQGYANTVSERRPCRVSFNPHVLQNEAKVEMKTRLDKWDPFWISVANVATGVTSRINHVQPQTPLIKTAFTERISFGDYKCYSDVLFWGRKRDNSVLKNSNYAVLLRMLPVDQTLYKKKRADCHLWPKGSFLMINGRPVQIDQRRQQAHDETEWKGMSRLIKIAEYINSPESANKIEMCCFDDQIYFYSIDICIYQCPVEVMKLALHPEKGLVQEIPFDESCRRARSFAARHRTLAVDSDDDDKELGKFIYSLCCPISKTIIQVPVRGKNCKHWQCYDLANYIQSNSFVTGSRWRCASCETFVALNDLEVCGLTTKLLEAFSSQVSELRDRVEYNEDGTYRLLEERKLRYANKKRAAGSAKGEENNNQSNKKLIVTEEVIDLL